MSASAARITEPEATIFIRSELLGAVRSDPSQLVTFTGGLFGFPECRGFVLVPTSQDDLYWLQSTEYTTLTFLLANPFLYFEGYAVDLPAPDMAELQATDASDLIVLAIVTLPRTEVDHCTMNLQGPVVLNVRTRLGRQIVLQDSDYGVRHQIDLDARRTGEAEE